MGWKRILILVFLFFYSCKNYYYTERGSVRPKTNKFELSKEPYFLNKGDEIYDNSIYVYEHKSNSVAQGEYFIRFFSNGRCIEGTSGIEAEKVDLDRINDFNNSGVLIGYYKVFNQKEIVIESFSVKKNEGGYYKKSYGYVNNDSLFISYGKNNYAIYVRRELEGLKGTPDW